jgi:hypothetical protein
MGEIHSMIEGWPLEDAMQRTSIVMIGCQYGTQAHTRRLRIVKEDEPATV